MMKSHTSLSQFIAHWVLIGIVLGTGTGCRKSPVLADSGYELLRAESRIDVRDGWSWLIEPDPSVVGESYRDELWAILKKPNSRVVSIMIAGARYLPNKSAGLWSTSVILSGRATARVHNYTDGIWSLFIVLPRGDPPISSLKFNIPVFVVLAKNDSTQNATAWRSWAAKQEAYVTYVETNHQGGLANRWSDWLEEKFLVLQQSAHPNGAARRP